MKLSSNTNISVFGNKKEFYPEIIAFSTRL